jgi:hypothetical protein
MKKGISTGTSASASVNNYKAWSAALYNKNQSYLTDVSGAYSTSGSSSGGFVSAGRTVAFNIYANGETGVANTTNIVTDSNTRNENASNNAAKYCRSIANPVTGAYNGYLGSLAEWIVVLDNLTSINNMFSKIGSSYLKPNTISGSNISFLTSCEDGPLYMWHVIFSSGKTYPYIYTGLKNNASNQYCAIPFFPLN